MVPLSFGSCARLRAVERPVRQPDPYRGRSYVEADAAASPTPARETLPPYQSTTSSVSGDATYSLVHQIRTGQHSPWTQGGWQQHRQRPVVVSGELYANGSPRNVDRSGDQLTYHDANRVITPALSGVVRKPAGGNSCELTGTAVPAPGSSAVPAADPDSRPPERARGLSQHGLIRRRRDHGAANASLDRRNVRRPRPFVSGRRRSPGQATPRALR
jgi:hypothetical protein